MHEEASGTRTAHGAWDHWRQCGTHAELLRNAGHGHLDIAAALASKFGVNARTAMRISRGWSQRETAARWNNLWPDQPKTAKSISYWERWPSVTGYAPSLDVLSRLAQLYECNVADLLTDLGNYRTGVSQTETSHRGASVSSFVDPARLSARFDRTICSLRTLVRIDHAKIEVTEDWSIQARQTLSEISVDVPRLQGPKPATGRVTVLTGGTLGVGETSKTGRTRHTLRLPKPLTPGSCHRYLLQMTVPRHPSDLPLCLYTPAVPTDHFALTVQFLFLTPPKGVWQVAQTHGGHSYNTTIDKRRLILDECCEAHAAYTNLSLGASYGIVWSIDEH